MNNVEDTSAELLNSLAEQAIDFHCHGVGRFDFTEIEELNLTEIENILTSRQQKAVLTLYLHKFKFDAFIALLDAFKQGKNAGKFTHIVGFGLEGPLLSSLGGTPTSTVWVPTKRHWKELALCGTKGLLYVIFSPDANLPAKSVSSNMDTPPSSMSWIAETLLSGGVMPTPGHFNKSNPIASAAALQSIFNVVAQSTLGVTLTDHFINDMPHNFKHAWRTPAEKAMRAEEIKQLNLHNWSLHSVEENLGLIPAVLIRNARKGIVKIAQNFDGEHVDLEVVKKTIDLVGAENMIFMTDSIESKRLAGRTLHNMEGSSLLYQDDGIVAAGSLSVLPQIKNMISMGLSLKEIDLITNIVPTSIIEKQVEYQHAEMCHI